MGQDIFTLAEHHEGQLQDPTHELIGKARQLAAGSGGEVVACLFGFGMKELAGRLAADRVLYVDHDAFAHFLPEAYAATLAALVGERDPALTLVANTTVGMDVAASVAGRAGRPIAAYAIDVALEEGKVVTTSQVFGGKLNAEIELEAGGIVSVIAGSFEPAEPTGSPEVEELPAPEALGRLRTKFLRRIEPEAADVDIAQEQILVSVGRGIGGEENIQLAQELADALGGVLSASRPITDSGWLPKTRQVGKSGTKVKPKLYVACGISGAPEHLEGMSDAELIIAINTDEKAPIFDVAHYGTTEDLFDVLPALTEKIQAGVTG